MEIEWYLGISAVMFTIGVAGILTRKNAIVMFMCAELMLNSVNLTLVAFSAQLGDVHGQILVLFALCVAAAEAAVGLAIIIAIYRNNITVDVTKISLLKW